MTDKEIWYDLYKQIYSDWPDQTLKELVEDVNYVFEEMRKATL